MNKSALNVDPNEVGRFAVGGLATGGGVAALWNLVRMLNEAEKAKKEKAKALETDEDTIVLTLPKKASVKAPNEDPVGGIKTYGADQQATSPDKEEVKSLNRNAVKKGRSGGQRVDPITQQYKTAAGWPTMTASVLAAIAGTAAGAALVDRLYQKHRENKLKKELESSKNEYIDYLSGDKSAEVIDQLFSLSIDGEKQADFGDRTLGLINYPLAVAAILSILGAGGTAYVTKKVLDQKFNEEANKGLDVPKIKRVVFRTSNQPVQADKLASDESIATPSDLSAINATIGILCDRISGSNTVLNYPSVKSALVHSDLNPTTFMDMSKDTHALLSYLMQNPQLTTLIERAYMDQHPVARYFKWSLKIPAVKRMADRKLMEQAKQYLAPSLSDAIMRSRDVAPGIEKTFAAVPVTTPALIAGMVGSSVMGGGTSKQDIADAVVEAEKQLEASKAEAKAKQSPEETAEAIKLEASDPAAKEYLAGHKPAVRKLLKKLVETGVI